MELKEAQKKIFQPFEIEVDDINKALTHYSKHYGIESKFLDFDTILNHPIGIIADFMELESVTHWMLLPEPPK